MIYAALGAIASSLCIAVIPASAAPAGVSTVSNHVARQSVSRNASALQLGSDLSTNYQVYCGQAGAAFTQVVTNRSLCDNTSIGGDEQYDVPVSQPTTEFFTHNSSFQEPFVLQQYDKVELFSR